MANEPTNTDTTMTTLNIEQAAALVFAAVSEPPTSRNGIWDLHYDPNTGGTEYNLDQFVGNDGADYYVNLISNTDGREEWNQPCTGFIILRTTDLDVMCTVGNIGAPAIKHLLTHAMAVIS